MPTTQQPPCARKVRVVSASPPIPRKPQGSRLAHQTNAEPVSFVLIEPKGLAALGKPDSMLVVEQPTTAQATAAYARAREGQRLRGKFAYATGKANDDAKAYAVHGSEQYIITEATPTPDGLSNWGLIEFTVRSGFATDIKAVL